MGLYSPGAAFVNPGTKLRQELTRAAVHRLAEIGWKGDDYRPLGECVDEQAIVNAMVALLATGGSTHHMIHLPANAPSAGIVIDTSAERRVGKECVSTVRSWWSRNYYKQKQLNYRV